MSRGRNARIVPSLVLYILRCENSARELLAVAGTMHRLYMIRASPATNEKTTVMTTTTTHCMPYSSNHAQGSFRASASENSGAAPEALPAPDWHLPLPEARLTRHRATGTSGASDKLHDRISVVFQGQPPPHHPVRPTKIAHLLLHSGAFLGSLNGSSAARDRPKVAQRAPRSSKVSPRCPKRHQEASKRRLKGLLRSPTRRNALKTCKKLRVLLPRLVGFG